VGLLFSFNHTYITPSSYQDYIKAMFAVLLLCTCCALAVLLLCYFSTAVAQWMHN